MSTKVLLLLFAVFGCVFALSREDKRVIDPFTPNTGPILILIPNQNQFPITSEAFTQDAGILGGERDLSLTVESGNNNLVSGTSVSSGSWSFSTPRPSRAFALMQYDGVDASIGLRENGLSGVDLRTNGTDAFRVVIQSDVETLYTLFVYSSGGGQSEFSISIPKDFSTNEYILEFNSFSGNANFGAVGAIEILIEALDSVDSLVKLFSTSGPV